MGCTEAKPEVYEPCRVHSKMSSGSQDIVPTNSGSSTQSTRSGPSPASSVAGGTHAGASLATQGTLSGSSAARVQPRARAILDKYAFTGRILGEGTSSMCYLGRNMVTGEKVAIKVYKHQKSGTSGTLTRFRRQVHALLELHKPFEKPADRAPWSEELARTEPSDLFVRLLDYSRDAQGEPGQDPVDGSMYVVTELAEHTLKSDLRQRGQESDPLPLEEVRRIAREVVLAVAGLHAKGFVHLDIKPENIMLCKGRWKLIDMDGCVPIGTTVNVTDNAVSFSPCYCAPEFARFIATGGSLVVTPGLDAWSVGMTIAELVNLTPLLRRRYQEISAGLTRQEGSARFLKWLAALPAPPVPGRGWSNDREFKKLLCAWLLVPDAGRRRTLVDSLSAAYFAPPES